MKRTWKQTRNPVMILLCLLLAVLFSGCQLQQEEIADYYMYYINQNTTGLERVAYEPEADESDTVALIEEFITVFEDGSDLVEYQRLYPETVWVTGYALDNGCLSLYFNEMYAQMDVVTEVLCREAVVEMMLQISDVTGVVFYVSDQQLCDANGAVVGEMTLDSFVDNPGEDINDIQEMDITLYFASLDGTSLVCETQHVYYYSSNISQEKLVMEQLLNGPKSENAQAALPIDTELISVSVLDGTCVVNLDENFLSQNYDIAEEVVIYSIVNSLTELTTVDKVQITVNGENNRIYRQEFSLTEFYTKNTQLVALEGESVEVDQEEQSEKEGLLEGIVE